ncbi:SDR family NAD(P)-dependent oxidoreductase [Bacillus sp. V2I10]|uniref:SDR family NAD(P)-dependent oxidoreductase n=1 Tax=Bacillus sp. V2I10 TaxID=3042276 RepID=UPI00277F81BA|nr:SDR family NAD(P)-dependent oxidoreductase [Bacillus sp. V2I10]MDQ0861530.1 NAD(P)-dependent dehydrogenase (short-subunit alcohol dehydrogenase family) [Bacillus sp. V2I10]
MLKNQTAIVTGASRGIRKEIAFQLSNQGMNLALVGSSDEIFQTAKELAEELVNAGDKNGEKFELL